MILIATKQDKLRRLIEAHLKGHGQPVIFAEVNSLAFFEQAYDAKITSVIVDAEIPGLPGPAARDLIKTLAGKIPTVALVRTLPEGPKEWLPFPPNLNIIPYDQEQQILESLRTYRRLNLKKFIKPSAIPLYKPEMGLKLLRENCGIGIIAIDTPGINKIGIDYGIDVSNLVKQVFHNLMLSLWGHKKGFRDTDVICRKKVNSNTYLLFIDRSRRSSPIPHPGALEHIAHRLSQTIQNTIWQLLFTQSQPQKFPTALNSIPISGVGTASILDNPCMDANEILEEGIESSMLAARDQTKKVKNRQKEFLQNIILSEKILFPNFQGVFFLQDLEKEAVEEAERTNNIKPIQNHIYGFESLIRVNAKELYNDQNVDIGLESTQLRPDILFSMARTVQTSLELDQACMKKAISYSRKIPGTLMVNILPRNLYYIDRLDLDWGDKTDIVFEVSEAEAINNFDLLIKSRKFLENQNMGIAADDFGTGFSSISRIMKIRPKIIKFDRSMIQNIHRDPIKKAYVRGLVESALYLQTLVLAEGVENWAEAACLKKMGVQLIQGFLTHKPQNIETILESISPSIKGAA